MSMYVILLVVVVVVLLVAGLLVLADRATDKERARNAAAEASSALTTVMPAILVEDHKPRHVALHALGGEPHHRQRRHHDRGRGRTAVPRHRDRLDGPQVTHPAAPVPGRV